MESLLIQHWYYNANQVLGSQPPTRRYHGRYHAPFFFGVFVAGAGQNRMTKKVAATKEEGIRNVHSHKQKMSNAECQGPHSQHKNSNCFTRWVVILSWVHIWSCFSQLLCGCMAELNHSKTPVLTFELLEVSFWTWDFVTHGNESNSPQHLGRRQNCHGNPFQFQGPFPGYIAHAAHGLCRLDHCHPSHPSCDFLWQSSPMIPGTMRIFRKITIGHASRQQKYGHSECFPSWHTTAKKFQIWRKLVLWREKAKKWMMWSETNTANKQTTKQQQYERQTFKLLVDQT